MSHCFATQVTTLSSPPPQRSLHSSIDNYSHRFREALGPRDTPKNGSPLLCVFLRFCWQWYNGNVLLIGTKFTITYRDIMWQMRYKTRVCLWLWDVQNVGFLRAVWSYHVGTVYKMIKVAAYRVAWLIVLCSPCCCDVWRPYDLPASCFLPVPLLTAQVASLDLQQVLLLVSNNWIPEVLDLWLSILDFCEGAHIFVKIYLRFQT